jgi:hypothetical protein
LNSTLYRCVFLPVIMPGIVNLLGESYRCVSTEVGEVHERFDSC